MATRIQKFEYLPHVQQRMWERGITDAQMEDAIQNPQSRHQQYRGTHGGIVWRCKKQQKTGKILDVVAELYKTNCYFITGFYEEEDSGADSGGDKDASDC